MSKIKLNLSVGHLDIVMTALVKLPYEQSARVIEDIMDQANDKEQQSGVSLPPPEAPASAPEVPHVPV